MVSPVSRILRSFGYALEGLIWVGRTQTNFWVHVVIGLAALVACCLLQVSAAECALVVLTIALVLAAESLNSGVEALADAVMPERHPLVKHAKDASAAAVLICALGAVAVGLIVFGPRLLALLPSGA